MEGCKEESFTAEKRRFDISCLFDFKPNTLLHGNNASGIDMQHFTGLELPIHNGSASVNKYHSIAFEFLHNETFTAEQPGQNLFLKMNTDGNALGSA